MSTISTEHIVKTPGTCGGRARIAGHRIRVMDVVVWHRHWGRTPEQIAESFPGITLADVHAALAYYYDHMGEIEADFEEDRKWDEYGKTQPSKLKEAIARNPDLLNQADG
jgi:uncharacterized protein (DUF433 family)